MDDREPGVFYAVSATEVEQPSFPSPEVAIEFASAGVEDRLRPVIITVRDKNTGRGLWSCSVDGQGTIEKRSLV